MGPDCGAAIIGGLPFGVARSVRRGKIGLVATTATGLQQVARLIDRSGQGISHAIGAGKRDLSARVGGSSTVRGLTLLAGDPETVVIVVISKPAAWEVMDRVLAIAAGTGKPTVVNLLGLDREFDSDGPLHFARTLDEAAAKAVELAGGEWSSADDVMAEPATVAR
jgi:succinyl-CoA synthetase alpha subunit